MLGKTLGCFIGSWTEVLDKAVSRKSCKLTPNYSAVLFASHAREEIMGTLTGKTRGIPPLTAFEPSR